jgi:hypothetical protein
MGKLNAPGEPEALGAGRAPGGRPGAGAGRINEGGIPPAPGGGRSDEKERERTTWLAEDRDIWTGGADAVPGVIGDAPNRLRHSKQDDDELLTVDELQELLDLVDEPAKETGEDLSQSATFHFVDEPGLSVGEEDLIDLDGDFFGPDDDASGVQRA